MMRARAIFLACLGAMSCSRADLVAITENAPDAGGSGGAASTCLPSSLSIGDSRQTIQVGGVTRSFLLHVPAAYEGTRPVPLIVDFHGLGSSGAAESTSSPYAALTDAEGVIIAFPDALSGPVGSAWNIGPCCNPDVDDLAFARALVARAEQLACIDSKRVYAVGILLGGGMVYDLGCRAADLFAGIAPAVFDLLQETVGDCAPSRPVTEISFRGTLDSRVPYAGGRSTLVPGMPVTFLGAENTFQSWASIDQCDVSVPVDLGNGCQSFAIAPRGPRSFSAPSREAKTSREIPVSLGPS